MSTIPMQDDDDVKKKSPDTDSSSFDDDQCAKAITDCCLNIDTRWPHWETKCCSHVPDLVSSSLMKCYALIPMSRLKDLQRTWIEGKHKDRYCIPDRMLAAHFSTLVKLHMQRAQDVPTYMDHVSKLLDFAAHALPQHPQLVQEHEDTQGGVSLDIAYLAQIMSQYTEDGLTKDTHVQLKHLLQTLACDDV